MTKRFTLLLVLVAALAAAGQASAAPATAWKGVIVAKDVKRGTLVTASADGTARTVRSAKARTLTLGQRLDVRAARLSDGTFKVVTLKATGRVKTTRLKAVVVRNQRAQHRLLVSAGGSTFSLGRKASIRSFASASASGLQAGDRIQASVTVTPGSVHATSVTTVGHLGVLEVEGILTKVAADSIELVVAKAGFVTLALPAGFTLPAGIAAFDEVEVHVAVGTDGKLTVVSIEDEDADRNDDDGVDVDEDEDELEVKGSITALSPVSITVAPGRAASPVTCALQTPLAGFKIGDFVELECEATSVAGSLRLKQIEHEDDDDDDDHDHSGPGHGGDDD
jgi:hypothetical protein